MLLLLLLLDEQLRISGSRKVMLVRMLRMKIQPDGHSVGFQEMGLESHVGVILMMMLLFWLMLLRQHACMRIKRRLLVMREMIALHLLLSDGMMCVMMVDGGVPV